VRGLATLTLAFGSIALAGEAPPIVVVPFHNRCFDAAALAQRVRAQLPDVSVSVGTPPAAAHQQVRVSGNDASLTVRLVAHNQRQQVVGSEERVLPLGDDCSAALETAALIIVRAATPLAFRNLPPPPPRRPPKSSDNRPREAESVRTSETPPSPAPQPSEIRPSEIRPPPAPQPSEIRPSEIRPRQLSENRTSDNRPSPAPQVSEIRPSASRRQRRLELDVVAMWSFPLDGQPSTPAGDFTVGWRWPLWRRLHLGAGLRVGVSGEWTTTTTSAQGPISVSARRIPLAAELRLDVDVPLGVVRISAGPEAAIWVAGSSGLPRPGSAVFAQPAAFVRLAYRLELGPVVVEAGLVLETAFIRDDLTVGGLGAVAQTPLVVLSPFAGVGIGFL
jgi:hypothetical protein